jgi:hypothetical protein
LKSDYEKRWARRARQILLQFLIESAILCALGGICWDCLLSWGVTVLITALASITMTITIGYILLALDRFDADRNDRRNLSGVQSRAARSDSGADAGDLGLDMNETETPKKCLARNAAHGARQRALAQVSQLSDGAGHRDRRDDGDHYRLDPHRLRQNIVAIIEEYGTNNIYAFHLSTGPRTGEDRSERLAKAFDGRRRGSDQGSGERG